MNANEHYCEALIIRRYEGGYVNHPRDPGGPTKYGITLKTLSAFRRVPCKAADVAAITEDEACAIYSPHYWEAAGCPALPSGLDLVVFNRAVLSGPVTAVIHLQRALARTCAFTGRIDGHGGPITTQAVADAVTEGKLPALISATMEAGRALERSLHTFDVFGKGWLSRDANVEKSALAMVGRNQVPVNASPAVVAALHPDIEDGTVPADDRGKAIGEDAALSKVGTGRPAILVAGTAAAATVGQGVATAVSWAGSNADALKSAGSTLSGIEGAGHAIALIGTGLTVAGAFAAILALMHAKSEGNVT